MTVAPTDRSNIPSRNLGFFEEPTMTARSGEDQALCIFFVRMRSNFQKGSDLRISSARLLKDLRVSSTLPLATPELTRQCTAWFHGHASELKTIRHLDIPPYNRKHMMKNQSILCLLPRQIALFTEVTVLCLNNASLTSLPAAIGDLTKLRQLILKNGQLKGLPQEIRELKELEVLDLSRNWQLSSLPDLTPLIKLAQLYLAPPNQIRSSDLVTLYFHNKVVVHLRAQPV